MQQDSTASLDRDAVHRRCRKFLSYDRPETCREILRKLADHPASDAPPDDFGKGAVHDLLEGRLCEILEKPAAVFMPTGRVAQLAALKVWCEQRHDRRVAMHPRCHVEEYEDRAYDHVYGLTAVTLGHPNRQTTVADLEALRDPVGVILLEIPLLALGCVLPPWGELVAMSEWARERGIPLHADGARLWECAPYYDRSPAEIAALFDTVTVSFYKSLNAMAGGAVLGPAEVIARVRAWQNRLGAAPFRMFPLVLDALRGLEERLDQVPAYHRKARSLAAALSALPGVRVQPDPPHATSMQVLLEGDPERLDRAALEVAAETGLWVVDFHFPAPLDGHAMFPLTVGGATMEVTDEEAAAAVGEIQRRISGG